LARAHIVAVAAPSYLVGRRMPREPADLGAFDGILMRSTQTGRIAGRVMRNRAGAEMVVELKPRVVFNDPEAICRAALMGVGVGLLAVPDVLPHLKSGALVRLLPRWYADVGAISLYFAGQRLLPAKTRAFVDFIVERFREQKLAARFSAL
jgi:DNA-binding transcriptional LysR family regulator